MGTQTQTKTKKTIIMYSKTIIAAICMLAAAANAEVDNRVLKMGKGMSSMGMKMKSSKKTDAPTAAPTITMEPTFSQFPSAEPSSSNYPSVSPTAAPKSMKMGKSSGK